LKRIFFLLLIISASSNAQTYLDSLNFFNLGSLKNNLRTKLEKQLNTYYLNSGIQYQENFDRFNIGLHESYHSTFISTDDKNIRDENSLLMTAGYRADSLISLRVSASNVILSDNRKIEINQASVSNIMFLTGISPVKRVYLSPFAGYTNNRQKLENDNGLIYGIGGLINRLDFNDLIVSSEFLFRNEDISPRKNFNRLFNISAVNRFGDQTENNLNLRFTESRKDFYYDADSIVSERFNIRNNIQSRTESNYLLQNLFLYNDFLNMFALDLTGRILWRNIDRNTRYKAFSQPGSAVFDTDINELRMEFESGLSYSSSVHNTSLRLTISQRDEKNITKNNPDAPLTLFQSRSDLEKRKNNTSTRTSLLLSSDLKLSVKDRITLSFLQNKLKYDTPSGENYDDRDEVLSLARVRYSRMLTPFFEFFTSLEGNYTHIVYIFSEQSSNNYVNRILKLNSGGSYRGKNFVSTNSFDVSANYTVYDFEDLNPNYRSFSFRQFTASDSSVLKFTKRFSFSFNGYIKLSEQGDLRWKSFSTKPNRYLEELYAEPRLVYGTRYVSISAGIRAFSLKTFLYRDNNRQLNTRYRSTGPVSEVIFTIGENLRSRFYGWYEFINLEDNREKQQVNINIEVEWNF
jgi:hypothetical protein